VYLRALLIISVALNDPDTGKTLVFLTNQRIKRFFGTS
jgi:hypothetical protein